MRMNEQPGELDLNSPPDAFRFLQRLPMGGNAGEPANIVEAKDRN